MSSGAQDLLNEHILVTWADSKNGTPHSLGSCSLVQRHAINLSMQEGIEPGTRRSYVYFSLSVGTKSITGRVYKEIRMIFQPHIFKNYESPLVFESLQFSNLDESSIIEKSDLTKSGHIIRVQFNLASQGYVVQPESKNPFKLTTKTSGNLVRGFESLSTILNFDVYMRQSDYAINGLQKLSQRMRDNTTNSSPIKLAGLFEGRNAVPMKWPDHQSSNQHQTLHKKLSPPPPPPSFYDEGILLAQVQSPPLYAKGSSGVQVPQSPPTTRREETSQPISETVLAKAPRTEIRYSPIPPTASQPSDRSIIEIDAELENDREGMESEIGPGDDYYATLQARELSLDRVAASFDAEQGLEDEIDPNEEEYATLQARDASQVREIASVSKLLRSELRDWIVGATTIYDNIYTHSRLTSRLDHLGFYCRTRNTKAFNSTMIWCSTILFCDPLDSGSIPELWNAKGRLLISDMAGLVEWSNKYCRSPEMRLSHIRDEFLRLGNTIRAVAELASQRNLDEYRRQRAECLAVVLAEFGGRRPGVSYREGKNSGP